MVRRAVSARNRLPVRFSPLSEWRVTRSEQAPDAQVNEVAMRPCGIRSTVASAFMWSNPSRAPEIPAQQRHGRYTSPRLNHRRDLLRMARSGSRFAVRYTQSLRD